MDLYVGIAKCLSEMSDTEIDRISRVTEVQYYVTIRASQQKVILEKKHLYHVLPFAQVNDSVLFMC